MKTPTNMLESIAADIIESTSLLEVIYRNNELPPEVDNAIACVIRSMQKTNETAYEYVEQLSKNITGKSNDTSIDIIDDILGCDADLVIVMDCQIPADDLIVHFF